MWWKSCAARATSQSIQVFDAWCAVSVCPSSFWWCFHQDFSISDAFAWLVADESGTYYHCLWLMWWWNLVTRMTRHHLGNKVTNSCSKFKGCECNGLYQNPGVVQCCHITVVWCRHGCQKSGLFSRTTFKWIWLLEQLKVWNSVLYCTRVSIRIGHAMLGLKNHVSHIKYGAICS